jgi:hypothetical protein
VSTIRYSYLGAIFSIDKQESGTLRGCSYYSKKIAGGTVGTLLKRTVGGIEVTRVYLRRLEIAETLLRVSV